MRDERNLTGLMKAASAAMIVAGASVYLAGCATSARSGLTTSDPRSSQDFLAPMRPPAANERKTASLEAPPQPAPESRFAYRGGKQGAYAPSQFWSGKEPPATAVPQSANVPQPTYVVPQTGSGTPQPGYYSPSQQRPVAAPAASAPYPQPPSQQQPPLTQANVSPAQSQPPAMPPSQGPAPIRMIDGRRVVEVRQGDTLFSIAKQNRVSMSALMSVNRLSNVQLVPGQQLVLPRG